VELATRTLIEQIQQLDAMVLARRLEPEFQQTPDAELFEIAPHFIARNLGLVAGQSLVNAGWSWTTGVGRPHVVVLGDETLPVFELALAVAKREDEGGALLSRLAATIRQPG
jgi:hypothetical protein